MNIEDAISGRRSIRAYKNVPLEKGTVERILLAATHAPSEGNLQAWRFYVCESDEVKERLVGAAWGQRFIAEAPAAVVVCVDLQVTASRYKERGTTLFCLQTSGAAIQNMLLTAHAMGLGTCWVGAFSEEDVRGILSLPGHLRPVAIIPIGHPVESPAARRRKSLDEVAEWV